MIGLMGSKARDAVAARVRVSGRVQGVFFRAETVRAARREGVFGWVRNCHNGTVEAVFVGPQQAVASVISWCRHGPTLAQVDNIDIEYFEPDELPTSFEIRY